MTKESQVWSAVAIPLAWLAELDNAPAPNALSDAFGDRYLYRHNPVFARIRDAAVALGYRFSTADTGIWRDYQSMSLTTLRRILSEKTIPYVDTGATIQRLLAENPAVRFPPRFIADNVRRNFTFHESAHCVAHGILARIGAELRAAAGTDRDHFVLEAILAESFANTVEAIASDCRHMPVSDQVFYQLNLYAAPNKARRELLDKATADIGAAGSFELLYFSYFEANLATVPPTDLTYERIAAARASSAAAPDLVHAFVDSGFALNAGFRESTTPHYFAMLGYSNEYKTLATAEWLGKPSNQVLAREVARLFHEAVADS